MALAHLALGAPRSPGWSLRGAGSDPRRRLYLGPAAGRARCPLRPPRRGGGAGWMGARGKVRSGKAAVGEAAPEGKVAGAFVEIPVSCYQIIGVTNQAEKDEIVKSVKELKSSEIEDGYSMDVILSRQDVLMDVRDKLLFEPDYAGNFKEKIPPRSSLRIPWAWLPGALCLLQEVGEVKVVLEIGRSALQHPDAKPYTHDLLLSMSLAELSFAKAAFEKRKVSQGFEALARAQYLLKSKESLKKLPLLSQIEESLEELAPACTLDLLSMPSTLENDERRPGAISALREMIRQGLEVEPSCRIHDWPSFLSQALSKLTAAEIVDLLSWDNLAVIRKNKKSLEYQNQRVVIDYNCFYLAMIAHIALGFFRRQIDLVSKAKAICESLATSEGVDLNFEDGLCSLLLGQIAERLKLEKLYQMDSYGSSTSANSESSISSKERTANINQSMEMFLKDAVLDLFPDTKGCSPSLASFFGGKRKPVDGGKHMKEEVRKNSRVPPRSSTFNMGPDRSFEEASTRHLGEAVKQLAPPNLQSQLAGSNTSRNASVPPVHLKRELGTHQRQFWETWASRNLEIAGGVACIVFGGCVAFMTFKLLCPQFSQIKTFYKMEYNPKVNGSTITWTTGPSNHSKGGPAFIDRRNILEKLTQMVTSLRKTMEIPNDNSSSSNGAYALIHKRQMPLDDAEALVKQWQTIKAEALGPSHKSLTLLELLDDPMLSRWQDLVDNAKAQSCFWKFVLLNISITRADIILDGVGKEMAEIEAIVEEAAELVDKSQPRNPSYYSSYKIIYLLKKDFDGSWRFYASDIQTPS